MFPNWITAFRLRVKALLYRQHLERDLNDELQFHLAMREEKLKESGVPAEEAHYAARRRFGNAAEIKDANREMWTFLFLETLWQDLRYGARQLGRNPGFTAVAVITLALGIGANTAIFTMANAVLWSTLPVKDPQQLVSIRTVAMGSGVHDPENGFPTPVLRSFLNQRQSRLFQGVFAWVDDGLSFEVGGQAERVMGEVVTANYFEVLGVKPFLGQMFSAAVRRGSWKPEVVLSYAFWKNRFGGDPGVIGRTFHLNGYAFVVVGISPPGFFGCDVGTSPEVRVPMLENGAQIMPALPLLDPLTQGYWEMMGRLSHGLSERQAQAATDVKLQRLLRDNVQLSSWRRYQGRHVQITGASRGISILRAQYERPLLILMGIAGLVLLIVCANVANLLLERAVSRRKEIAVRLAVGAGRWRMVRQLITESVLLSAIGGVLGLLLAVWGTRLLLAFMPQTNIRISLDLQPDSRVLVFTLVVAALAGVLFSLVPSLQSTKPDIVSTMKVEMLGAAEKASRRFGLRRMLVVSEVAISMVLLVSAGLLVRSLQKLDGVNPGFNPDKILLFTMKPVHERYTPARMGIFYRELLGMVRALPGVRAASLAETGPFNAFVRRTRVFAVGGETTPNGVDAVIDNISPGFFGTMEIPVDRGRDFLPADTGSTHKVVIVNEVAAHDLFGNEDPIGREIGIGDEPGADQYQIVGMVPSVKYASLNHQTPPEAFIPMQSMPWMPVLQVRTSGTPSMLVRPVLQRFTQLDKTIPVFDIKTLQTQIDQSIAPERLIAILSGFFAALAALLAAVGIYGVIAYTVDRQTREIGIRMALGAQRSEVVRMVLRATFLMVGCGLAIGLVLALAACRAVSGMLFGIRPDDPVTFSSSCLLVLVLAVLASYIPARRAANVDPMVALRYE